MGLNVRLLLQTLYAAMHEPDGVRGVNALRREEPSLREQILEHESIGLLRDATACYDRAIQLESDQVPALKPDYYSRHLLGVNRKTPFSRLTTIMA